MKSRAHKKNSDREKKKWEKSAAAPELSLSPARKWLFRFVALTFVPLALFVGLELILRLAGYGHPTGFFEKARIGGKEYLVNNEDFSRRFFPPQLMRWPEPVMIELKKPADTYRIFILGESAARGEPSPNYAASRYLQVLLEARFPRTHFEVVNLGITAINSHVILPIARDCAPAHADLWIIYMGNNEMVGPFGAATVFGAKSPPLNLVRFYLALQETRTGQLLVNLLGKLHETKANKSWGGMQMFIGNQLRADDARKEVVYQNFAKNLQDILQAGLNSGAKILLNTVAVNLKDCPPFASLTNAALSASNAIEFGDTFATAQMMQSQGAWMEAGKNYEAAARLDADFPDLQFRWAECLLQTGDAAAAREHFQKACDVDALPFRADSRINGIIAAAGKKFAGGNLDFFDAATALAAQTKDAICGDETFYEHVHFNFDGEFRLGRAWAAQVEKMLPPEILSRAATNEWASQEVCEARLGLTDWNRRAATGMIIDLVQRPPLNSQSNNRERLNLLRTEFEKLGARMNGNWAQSAAALYLKAIDASPADPQLRENFAEFLESAGDLKSALAQREAILSLLPRHCVSLYHVGRLLEEMNQFGAAETYLMRAVALRPRLAEGWSELGKVHLGMGQIERALADFQRAIELDPSIAMNHALAGNALAKLNRRAEAIECYRRALEIQPDFLVVEFALGNELAAVSQFADAKEAYLRVIKLKPDHVLAHLNLGVVEARLSQFDEAHGQFQEVLRLDPENRQAREDMEEIQGWQQMGR